MVMLALNSEHYFVEVPFVAGPKTPPTQLVSALLAKLATPLADGLIGHHDFTFISELFHITEAQTEQKYSPTAWLMISTGKRWFLYVLGAAGVAMF
jgi:hypothetical protein